MKPPLSRACAPYSGVIDAALEWWSCCANLAELWWTRHGGITAANLAAQRLQALVAHARAHSPYYRRLYARLPADGFSLQDLPVVTKQRLMARFDEWPTDPRVRRRELEAFLADRRRIGEPFLGRYRVWKSSGSTGVPGLFVQDAHAMAVYDALVATQLDALRWSSKDAARALGAVPRAALVAATGDHFASIASWERIRRAHPGIDARGFSVLDPLPRLVAGLNAFRPSFIAGYPSVLALLAREQAARRLAIEPVLAWSGGEHLAPATQRAIERAFGCPVMNEYGASECLSIAYGCAAGWMHVNSEWVILEGVDRAGRPVPPGEMSHTTLLTNLANWVQPVIRYDLGDRIVAAGTPCGCGNPLPAIRVEGRTDDVVKLRPLHGRTVRLPPLALATVVEDAVGEARFQIAQVAPDRLRLRLEGPGGGRAGAATRARAAAALHAWLATQSLANVRLEQDRAAPRRDAASGKLRAVVVE